MHTKFFRTLTVLNIFFNILTAIVCVILLNDNLAIKRSSNAISSFTEINDSRAEILTIIINAQRRGGPITQDEYKRIVELKEKARIKDDYGN